MDVPGIRSSHPEYAPVRHGREHEPFEWQDHGHGHDGNEHEDRPHEDEKREPFGYVDINQLIAMDLMVSNRKRRLQEQAQHHHVNMASFCDAIGAGGNPAFTAESPAGGADGGQGAGSGGGCGGSGEA